MPGEGPAKRKRLTSTDAITSRSEQPPCNLRIACLPACSCHSPGQGRKAANVSTRSYLEGRAFRTRHQHEGQVPGRPHRGVDLVKHGVVVSRIVVKRNESSGSAQRGERERVSHRTMPPSNPLLVLLGSVLCVMDQQVRIRGQVESRRPLRLRGERAHTQGGFVIRQIGERAIPLGDLLSDRRTGMANLLGLDLEPSDLASRSTSPPVRSTSGPPPSPTLDLRTRLARYLSP